MKTFYFFFKRVPKIILSLFRLAPLLLPSRRKVSTGPELLRSVLQDIGGAWAKLGQALALRFDLLPPAYCHELFKLLDQMTPFPYEKVRKIIEEDLGAEPESVFSFFDPNPFAVGTIAQVHHATLRTGQKVAVKVQRPDVRYMFEVDIRLMYALASCLDFSWLLGATRTHDVFREFARWFRNELDFTKEARHAQTLGLNAKGDRREYDPVVYAAFSTERVFTMSLIEGEPLVKIVKAIGEQDRDPCSKEYLKSLQSRGYDLDQIAHNILWNTLNQVFQHAHFHADLHPANLFVLPGNRIGYVDFGIVGLVPEKIRDSLAYHTWHLFRGDIDRSTEELMRWVTPSARTDISCAMEEVRRIADDYVCTLKRPVYDSAGAGFYSYQMEVFNAVRRHEMVLASYIVMPFKALIAAIILVYQLNPQYDLRSDGCRFFSLMVRKDVTKWLHPAELLRLSFDWKLRVNRVSSALESLSQVGPEISNGMATVRRRIQWLAVLALASALGCYAILTKQVTQVPGLPPAFATSWLPGLLLGLFIVSILVLLGQTKRLPSRHRGG